MADPLDIVLPAAGADDRKLVCFGGDDEALTRGSAQSFARLFIESLEQRTLLTTYSINIAAQPSSETVTVDYTQDHQTANVAFTITTTFKASNNDKDDHVTGLQLTLDPDGGSVVNGSVSSTGLSGSDGINFSGAGDPGTYAISEQISWTNAQRGVKHVELDGTLTTFSASPASKSDFAVQTITIPAGSLDMPGVSGLDKQTIGADVLLNNDDDNFDGIPDNHNGYTLGENDLVPLTLHASGAGGRYQLEFTDSGDSQALKIWAKSDKSASDADTHIVGGTGVYRIGNDQTILDASVDTTLYVEGFNFGVDTITLRWKSDTSNSPYNPADYIKVWVYGVKLMYQSQDVTSAKAADVLVGQFEQVSTQIFGPEDVVSNPTYSWTVDGKAFKDYTLDSSPTNPTLTTLTSSDLNQSNIGFFWTDSGNKNVQCNIMMDGHMYSRSTRFTSQTPTATLATTTGQVNLGLTQPQGGDSVLQVGSPGADGFTATASVQVPAGFSQGNWAFLQVVNSFDFLHGGGKTYYESDNSNPFLDVSFPAPNVRDSGGNAVSNSLLSTGTSSFTFFDTPSDVLSADHLVSNRVDGGYGTPSPTQIDGETRDENYDTYVMFKPSGTNSKWVPLKTVHWSWKADASVVGQNPDGGPHWSLNSYTDPAASAVSDVTDPPSDWYRAFHENWLEE